MMIPRNSGPKSTYCVILDENRGLNTKETIQSKTQAAVKRATKKCNLFSDVAANQVE